MDKTTLNWGIYSNWWTIKNAAKAKQKYDLRFKKHSLTVNEFELLHRELCIKQTEEKHENSLLGSIIYLLVSYWPPNGILCYISRLCINLQNFIFLT